MSIPIPTSWCSSPRKHVLRAVGDVRRVAAAVPLPAQGGRGPRAGVPVPAIEAGLRRIGPRRGAGQTGPEPTCMRGVGRSHPSNDASADPTRWGAGVRPHAYEPALAHTCPIRPYGTIGAKWCCSAVSDHQPQLRPPTRTVARPDPDPSKGPSQKPVVALTLSRATWYLESCMDFPP